VVCATTISGTPAITSDADFGPPGAVCLDGATLQFQGFTIATDRPLVLYPAGATLRTFWQPYGAQVWGSGEVAVNGPISGPGGLTVSGSGFLTLSGANSYQGGTAVTDPQEPGTAGILVVRADENLGAASGGVVLGPGRISFQNDFQSNRALTLTGNGVFAANSSNTGGVFFLNGNHVTWSGSIGGIGALVIIGPSYGPQGSRSLSGGTLTLTNANTFSGDVVPLGITLAIGADANLGSPSNRLVLRGTVQFLNGFTSNRLMSATLGGTLDTNGHDVTWSGDISGSYIGDQINAGNGPLTKAGAGTLTLTGHNTFVVHPIRVTAGTLAVQADENLGPTNFGPTRNGVELNGGGFRFLSGFSTARSITLETGGGTIDTGSNDVTLTGAINGPGQLTKLGSGTLTLSGPVSYTGGTVILGGKVVVARSLTP
jgi:fibronectin-binding autotransporter adhesin